ncbi:MAG: GNAT family N-acetyltransferase [Chitinophagales bacterium]
MSNEVLSVREIQEEDIAPITQYWLDSDKAFMAAMGVDTTKIPGKDEWREMLLEQLNKSYEEKKSYCIIWQVDGRPVGHSNINKIIFGEEAYMHLHIWTAEIRNKGFGASFIKMTLPWFFEKYGLKKLYCEPYALNPAPNKTLKKIGFEFVKKYVTTPGWLNFEQPVKLWMMSREKFDEMK